MVDPNVNISKIPPIGSTQIGINSEKVVKEMDKPDVAMFDNAPNDVSLGSFFGKIFIGIMVGICVAALLLGVLTIGKIGESGDNALNSVMWLLPPIAGFIVGLVGNVALAGLYNIFFSKRYYDFSKMFGLIFVSSLIITIFFFAIYSLCYNLFDRNITLLYTILGFQIIFGLFISINLMDFLSQPNYSASSLMGNMFGCVLSIVLHILIIYTMKDKTTGEFDFNFWCIMGSAVVAYTMTIFGSSLWDAIYYKFYEWGNNPFYLPSLNELREERKKEELKKKAEEEEVNVEVK